jgi:hypothetical protein
MGFADASVPDTTSIKPPSTPASITESRVILNFLQLGMEFDFQNVHAKKRFRSAQIAEGIKSHTREADIKSRGWQCRQESLIPHGEEQPAIRLGLAVQRKTKKAKGR